MSRTGQSAMGAICAARMTFDLGFARHTLRRVAKFAAGVVLSVAVVLMPLAPAQASAGQSKSGSARLVPMVAQLLGKLNSDEGEEFDQSGSGVRVSTNSVEAGPFLDEAAGFVSV